MKRLEQLDGLRFIMILIIVLSHFEFLKDYSYGNFYIKYLQNAVMAVDYFFILSGFGIMYNSSQKPDKDVNIKSSIMYGINKIKKIYPLYVFSIILVIPYMALMFKGNLLHESVELASSVGLALTLLQSLSGTYETSHKIKVVWFLSTLFICYMLCPLFKKLCNKYLKNKKSCVLGLIFNIIIILLFTFIFMQIEKRTKYNDLVYGSPYIRCFYLLLGMVISKLYILTKDKFEINPKLCSILQYSISIISVIWFIFRNSINLHFIFLRLIDLVLCVLLIYFICFSNGKISKKLSKGSIVKLGKNSMYIFLLHYPVRLYVDYFICSTNPYIGILKVVIIVLIASVLCVLSYKIFNKLNFTKKCNNLKNAGI